MKDGSPMAAKQFNSARIFGVVCAIVLTAGILWMANSQNEPESEISPEFAFVEVKPEESIWGKWCQNQWRSKGTTEGLLCRLS